MISVVIPAFNRATLIGDTIRSLLDQSLPAKEIIIVDDGSTDATAEVAGGFGPPVRVVRQTNSGPAAARNRGLREATGDFIHFFDSDDLALPDKHAIQRETLQRTGADIAFGPWIKGHFAGGGFLPENHVYQQRGLPSGCLTRALLCDWSIIPHACLFRREVVERTGGFPESLWVGEDQLMFLRCLLAGARVAHSPLTLVLYRTDTPNKLTATNKLAKARQHRDWARFLCLARAECLSQGIDPAAWRGFSQRAWQAEADLNTAEEADPELIQSLRDIHKAAPGTTPFALATTVRTKWQGLMARITGGRGNASFQMGPLTPQQVEEVRRLFHTLGCDPTKSCAV